MRRCLFVLVLVCAGCDPVLDGGNTRDDLAWVKAEELTRYARTHAARNGGERVERLADLVPYSTDGEAALLDPWGQQYQFKYVAGEEGGDERLVVWTVNPKTGKTICYPRGFEDRIGPGG